MSVQELLKLPADERAQLADALLESLDAEADDGADAEWGEEIRRRVENAAAGRVTAPPWSDARKAILSDDDAAG